MDALQLLHVLSHFLSFLVYLWLISYVVRKEPRALLNRLCALAIIPFAIWALGITFFHSATSSSAAMLWMNIASVGWCSFPITAFWFYLALTRHEGVLRNRITIVACALLAVFFTSQQWTGHLIVDLVKQPYGWSTVWATSALPVIFFAYYFVFIAGCIYLTFNFGRGAKSLHKKKQARLLCITPAICLALGSATDVILPELGIGLVPPVAVIIILIWGGGLVYAITRYRLMTLTPAAAADNILSTMSDPLILVDPNGKVITANKTTFDLLGYEEKELLGKEFTSIASQSGSTGDLPFLQSLEGGTIHNRELTYRAKSGEIIPVLLSASAMNDEEGELVGFITVARDITEYQKMGQALRESEQKYRNLVDHALVGIGIHQDGKIIYANGELASLLGYALEEGIGLSIAERIHPDERNMVMTRAQRRQAGSTEPETYETRLLKKDGSIIYTLISNVVIEYGGRPATLMTIADISDTKARRGLEQANRELKKLLDRLEQISEERKQVLLAVSHDLRTPLTSIVGFSDLLMSDASLAPSTKEYLQIINDESLRLNRLVNDILDISRDEASKLEWHMGPQDLSEIMHSSISSVSVMAEEKGLNIEVNVPDNLPIVYGDKDRLQQVMINLLSNAIKSTPQGKITIGIEKKKQDMLVWVADTGIGIRDEDRDKLFKPFGRTTDRYDGAGLGLSICKVIVDHHGGDIWFESEFGKGTTFYFAVPLAEIAT